MVIFELSEDIFRTITRLEHIIYLEDEEEAQKAVKEYFKEKEITIPLREKNEGDKVIFELETTKYSVSPIPNLERLKEPVTGKALTGVKAYELLLKELRAAIISAVLYKKPQENISLIIDLNLSSLGIVKDGIDVLSEIVRDNNFNQIKSIFIFSSYKKVVENLQKNPIVINCIKPVYPIIKPEDIGSYGLSIKTALNVEGQKDSEDNLIFSPANYEPLKAKGIL